MDPTGLGSGHKRLLYMAAGGSNREQRFTKTCYTDIDNLCLTPFSLLSWEADLKENSSHTIFTLFYIKSR